MSTHIGFIVWDPDTGHVFDPQDGRVLHPSDDITGPADAGHSRAHHKRVTIPQAKKAHPHRRWTIRAITYALCNCGEVNHNP